MALTGWIKAAVLGFIDVESVADWRKKLLD
jgi:hypothetical protein